MIYAVIPLGICRDKTIVLNFQTASANLERIIDYKSSDCGAGHDRSQTELPQAFHDSRCRMFVGSCARKSSTPEECF